MSAWGYGAFNRPIFSLRLMPLTGANIIGSSLAQPSMAEYFDFATTPNVRTCRPWLATRTSDQKLRRWQSYKAQQLASSMPVHCSVSGHQLGFRIDTAARADCFGPLGEPMAMPRSLLRLEVKLGDRRSGHNWGQHKQLGHALGRPSLVWLWLLSVRASTGPSEQLYQSFRQGWSHSHPLRLRVRHVSRM
jgi:hypothetical protein